MSKTKRQESLFSDQAPADNAAQEAGLNAPLAERARPQTLQGFIGQHAILGEGRPLRKAIEQDRVPSMVLWGPPGSGKTTLARLIAKTTQAHFLSLSATNSGAKELRHVVEQAQANQRQQTGRTILFIDEIHRWNKSQQDALLPHVESGLMTLIGATTENPSFELNGALLSRCTVFVMHTLSEDEMQQVIGQGAAQLAQEGLNLTVVPEAVEALASYAQGDARTGLNALEQAVLSLDPRPGQSISITVEVVQEALQKKRLLYDKAGEEHYNLISALHKSMRGSDPQATLYWLARMLEAGEDPLYLLRRIIRFASEDIGLADPNALLLANAARDAYQMLGSPEGDLAIAEAAVYLATAPKSNAVYRAFHEARAAVKNHGYLPVPLHIRNAPTKLMSEVGYGKGYQYAHDHPDAVAEQQHLPDKLKDAVFYQPTERGTEQKIRQRMEYWQHKLREQKAQSSGDHDQ